MGIYSKVPWDLSEILPAKPGKTRLAISKVKSQHKTTFGILFQVTFQYHSPVSTIFSHWVFPKAVKEDGKHHVFFVLPHFSCLKYNFSTTLKAKHTA